MRWVAPFSFQQEQLLGDWRSKRRQLIASLRQVVEQRGDGAPKRIGASERELRMNVIKTELAGLSISEENELSHALLERVCQIYGANNLKYIEQDRKSVV